MHKCVTLFKCHSAHECIKNKCKVMFMRAFSNNIQCYLQTHFESPTHILFYVFASHIPRFRAVSYLEASLQLFQFDSSVFKIYISPQLIYNKLIICNIFLLRNNISCIKKVKIYCIMTTVKLFERHLTKKQFWNKWECFNNTFQPIEIILSIFVHESVSEI